MGEGVRPYELTKFFTVFVMLQWWNLFNAKTLGSRHSAFRHFFWGRAWCWCWRSSSWASGSSWTLGGKMFRTEPHQSPRLAAIVVFTLPVLLVGELYRRLEAAAALHGRRAAAATSRSTGIDRMVVLHFDRPDMQALSDHDFKCSAC